MRVAAIYDIHGNLPALEAVLEEVSRARVGLVVVGGDVLPGPLPAETLARLLDLALPVRFLYGNGEVAVLEAMAGKNPSAVPEVHWPVFEWTARQVSGYEDTLRSWPKTVAIEIPALGRVLFCHATPRDDNEIFTRLTPEEKLVPVFDAAGAPLAVCGHTHMQFDRMVGQTRVINAGSVGMPFGHTGADWLLLSDAGVELQRTDYDLEAAARRIRASAYPDREGFVENYLLHPPTEEQMLAAFGAAELTT